MGWSLLYVRPFWPGPEMRPWQTLAFQRDLFHPLLNRDMSKLNTRYSMVNTLEAKSIEDVEVGGSNLNLVKK